ncbi:MAG: fused MFS/spermidine synthase, partial [Planctomycetaceae bacterium]|nr:fused MFS/spermidine synthase [Planctomycetaceae bacterium]
MSGRYVIFVITTTLSAVLLFIVQPMIAKALLPHFGGAPAVWATCLVFFQTLLLLGYVLTDRLAHWCGSRRHVAIQFVLLILAAVALPLTIPVDVGVTGTQSPVVPLLLVLLRTAGLPFLALSMMAPAVQRWFSAGETAIASSEARVYRLYALSNAGSLISLLAYPLVIEPRLSLSEQGWGWSLLYGVLILCVGLCWLVTKNIPVETLPSPAPTATRPLPWGSWTPWVWVGLAFLPSTLLSSCTTYLTVEILPFPLLWAVPLALYLATYIVAFSVTTTATQRRVGDVFTAVLLTASAWAVATRIEMSLVVQTALHLATLTAAGLSCHLHLAAARPAPSRLTEYYVWISVGGMLGGFFNAIIAPQCFHFIAEYPLSLVMTAAIIGGATVSRGRDYVIGASGGFLLGVIIALFATGLLFGAKTPAWGWGLAFVLLLPLLWWPRPWTLMTTLGVVTFACTISMDQREHLVDQTRSFFGVHRVIAGATGKTYSLQHGSTTHGLQFRDADLRIRRIPLTYYFPTGPVGQIFVGRQEAFPYRVGTVGLGIGTLATYGRPHDRFDFFEIDPAVAEIARDSGHFTQLRDSAAECRIKLGDARQTLAAQPDGVYDILVLDAFTGDSVPSHLLTAEAFQLYKQKLKPDGLLAMHISSRYLNLTPVAVGGA